MSTKESHGWHDLPQPVQLEIFAFLSVKHVAKVHSLSKAISQQLDESEYYWQELAVNYARKINPDLIDQVTQQSADQSATPREKYSKLFNTILIRAKIMQIEKISLQREVLQKRKQLELLRMRMLKSMKSESTNTAPQENEETDNLKTEIEKLQFD